MQMAGWSLLPVQHLVGGVLFKGRLQGGQYFLFSIWQEVYYPKADYREVTTVFPVQHLTGGILSKGRWQGGHYFLFSIWLEVYYPNEDGREVNTSCSASGRRYTIQSQMARRSILPVQHLVGSILSKGRWQGGQYFLFSFWQEVYWDRWQRRFKNINSFLNS